MNKIYSLFLFVALFISCDKKDETLKNDIIEKGNISGYFEKGPFAIGSKVTLSELNAELVATGKLFETTTTENNGSFEFENIGLISRYIQISVNGFFFDEMFGGMSMSPITLWALVDVKDRNKVNANVISHMEMPRVKYLIKNDKKSFDEAKRQARKEVLACFYIYDEIPNPEEITITGEDKNAAILIAISSILIRNNGTGSLSEMMSMIGLDLEKDGVLNNEAIVNYIKTSSSQFNESDLANITRNIRNRYESFGQTINVPYFGAYIDYDGDGNVGGEVPEDPSIGGGGIFDTEEGYMDATAGIFIQYQKNNYNYNYYEALFSQTINLSDISDKSDIDIYNGNISSELKQNEDLWANSYYVIANINNIISNAESNSKPQIKYYGANANVFRAMIYLKMVNLWGKIPFPRVTSQTISPFVEKSEIIKKLIEDVNNAIPQLKTEEAKLGIRFSVDMANAILAKLYVENLDYGKALEYAEKVIATNRYLLYSDRTKIFSEQVNDESLFLLDLDKIDYGLINKGKYAHFTRYPEILLIAAESQVKLKNYDKAIEYLNILRKRNGHTLLVSSTEKEIIDTIIEEWKYDLKYEGFVFAAMKRLGLVEQGKYFPIPNSETNWH